MLLTLLVPSHIYFTPLYLSFQSYGPFGWNLLETPLPLFLLSLTGVGLKDGLVIYIMRQFFRGYPKELEEAASIDGAGTMHTFTAVMLPGALPVTATCFLFTFVWKWTDPTYTELFMPRSEFIWTKLATIGSSLQLLPGGAAQRQLLCGNFAEYQSGAVCAAVGDSVPDMQAVPGREY